MTDFGIQFNKNSFGLVPSGPLTVPMVPAGQTVPAQLILSTQGQVQKMDPLNTLQVAIKNNLKVFYFATEIPLEVLFAPDGKMDRQGSGLRIHSIAKKTRVFAKMGKFENLESLPGNLERHPRAE